MKVINSAQITEEVKRLCIEGNLFLGKDVVDSFKQNLENEESDLGKDVLNILIENAKIACEKEVPICQDTGMAVFFVKVGQDVRVEGDTLTEAINKGVSLGYTDGYLRKSVVSPIHRVNTQDNTPAVIHYDMVKGDKIEIVYAPKGFGSENMSQLKMLKPSDGLDGIKKFIVDVVSEAGPNPCPPIVVGVGIGGTVDKCAQIAKKSVNTRNWGAQRRPIYCRFGKRDVGSCKQLRHRASRIGWKNNSTCCKYRNFPNPYRGTTSCC